MEDKWISVEDRLPEVNSDLAMLVGEYAQCGYYLPTMREFRIYSPKGCSTCFPTHWQPLPTPSIKKQTK